ncbi:MAG: hypothetical protein ACKODX_14750 [Gemmata sp.]
MFEHPADAVRTAGVGVLDAAGDLHLSVDRAEPRDGDVAVGRGVQEQRPRGQLGPRRDLGPGGVDDGRRGVAVAPGVQPGLAADVPHGFREWERLVAGVEQPPHAVVAVPVRVRVPGEQVVDEVGGGAPRPPLLTEFRDLELHERRVGPVVLQRGDGEEDHLARLHLDLGRGERLLAAVGDLAR